MQTPLKTLKVDKLVAFEASAATCTRLHQGIEDPSKETGETCLDALMRLGGDMMMMMMMIAILPYSFSGRAVRKIATVNSRSSIRSCSFVGGGPRLWKIAAF